MIEITRAAKLKEVRRELVLRHQHYPRYVEDRRMGSVEADTRIATMRAIVDDYSKPLLNETQRRDLLHAIRYASIAEGNDLTPDEHERVGRNLRKAWGELELFIATL